MAANDFIGLDASSPGSKSRNSELFGNFPSQTAGSEMVSVALPQPGSGHSSDDARRNDDIDEAITLAMSKQQNESSADGAKSVCSVLLWLYVLILSTYAAAVSTRNLAVLGECDCGDAEAVSDAQLLADVDMCAEISICLANVDSATNSTSNSPTEILTSEPTANPSDFVDAITVSPSSDPSTRPSIEPSMIPSTPTPLYDGDLMCGMNTRGEYNDEPLQFTVRMLFDGDLTFNASRSDFIISSLVAVNLDSDTDGDGVLSLTDLNSDLDFVFTLSAAPGTYGEFVVDIECTSNAPTKAPTTEPTSEPSMEPTSEPTKGPTSEPSIEPTTDPTEEPTMEPTMGPTEEPTTEPTSVPTQSPTDVPTNTVTSAEILPQTSIVIWSDCANIPNGWTLCDGSNGTPDLQGRFVVGGGTSTSTFNYGDVGGASTHSHTISTSATGSVGSTALSIAQMPSHNHGNGNYQYLLQSNCGGTVQYMDTSCGEPDIGSAQPIVAQGSGQTHTHGLAVSASSSASSTSQLPPYFTLCYIMKDETQTWVVES